MVVGIKLGYPPIPEDDLPKGMKTTDDIAREDAKAARLTQLAAARESAKVKKRQREEDMSSMKSQLDNITSMLASKPEVKVEPKQEPELVPEEEPPAKVAKVVVTKQAEPEVEVVDQGPSIVQSVIKTGALVALGAASFYMNNVYGKGKKPTTDKPVPKPAPVRGFPQPTLLASKPKRPVGKSGFVA